MLAAAVEKLLSARSLHEQGHYNDALSRAYYAAFHAASLPFFIGGRSFSRHGQLIGAFNKEFIASGALPKELGKALSRLYDARQSSVEFLMMYNAVRTMDAAGKPDASRLDTTTSPSQPRGS